MLEAVIFDMDGVIIDSEPFHLEVVVEILKECNIAVSHDRIVRYVGVSNSSMWADLRREYDIDKTVPQLIDIQHAKNIAVLNRHDDAMIPGIPELLAAIKYEKLKTAIASSSSPDYIDAVVKKLRLARQFDVIVSGEQVVRGKPEPDIFIKTAESLGVDPAECVVIEDSDHGIRAARRAGIRVIGFRNVHSGRQSLREADHIVDSMEEITMELLHGLV